MADPIKMNESTQRVVRLNAKFNFEDDKPERGFINITGKVKGISEIEIRYFAINPDKIDDQTRYPIHTTATGAEYNESNIQNIRLF